jgi:hypothetical protein
MWASCLAGLGGYAVMWAIGDSSWELQGALDNRSRFQLTIFADTLEFAYLRTSSMDAMIDLSSYNEGYEYRELTRLWSGSCGECGCDDYPTYPVFDPRPPEWLTEMLPKERAPTHGILVRFSLVWPSRVLLLIPLVWCLIARDRVRRRLAAGLCSGCEYPLTPIVEFRCPECGDLHQIPSWIRNDSKQIPERDRQNRLSDCLNP